MKTGQGEGTGLNQNDSISVEKKGNFLRDCSSRQRTRKGDPVGGGWFEDWVTVGVDGEIDVSS